MPRAIRCWSAPARGKCGGRGWRTRTCRKTRRGDGTAARSGPDQAFSRLSLELAFQIMSAEPALATFGMTRSWEAFEHFNRGLAHWRTFALHRELGDPDALSEAIQRFRKATAIDPGFALAHYRLGVALSNDGQPLAGAEALRASLKANPGFVPAMIALAYVLYSSEQDAGALLIGSPKTPGDSMGTTGSRRHGASGSRSSASPAGHRRSIARRPGPGCVATRSTSRIRASRDRSGRCPANTMSVIRSTGSPTSIASKRAALRSPRRDPPRGPSRQDGPRVEARRHRHAARATWSEATRPADADWQCSRAGIDEAALARDEGP